jgi:uncharacterized protein with PQ loop repeat
LRESSISEGITEADMSKSRILMYAIIFGSVVVLCGCDDLVPRDTASLLAPRFKKSEVFGLVAGFGTTFAAVPDMIAMFKRRSSEGMNPRMATILGFFQIIWVYYGLLIQSRPVIVWNVIAVLINFLSVFAYRYFVRLEKEKQGNPVAR